MKVDLFVAVRGGGAWRPGVTSVTAPAGLVHAALGELLGFAPGGAA